MKNTRLSLILAAIAAILLLPWLAMQYSDAVQWTMFDFIVASILLLTTGISCEIVLRKAKSRKRKIALCMAVLILFLLIWIELAVGII